MYSWIDVLDLNFEPTLHLKPWNLRALQNEIHMRVSILNIDYGLCAPGPLAKDGSQ
jgi:hypothetical protein